MPEIEKRKAGLEELLSAPTAPPVVRLLPDITEVYASRGEPLIESLNDADVKVHATELVRGLGEKMMVTPLAETKGIDLVPHGDHARIPGLLRGRGGQNKIPAADAAGIVWIGCGERI